MERDTITAAHVADLLAKLDAVGEELTLIGTLVRACSPLAVTVQALREQQRALERTAVELHRHLAREEESS